MRKNFVLIACFLGLALAVSAQVRDYIPIIRPVYFPETVDFLNKLSESMKKDGYDSAAAALKAYAKGGFGSGFVIVASDGSNYVVTNWHVINEAASVTLEFQKGDGSQILYENCSVIAVDDVLDLALVAFPQGVRPFKVGLALSLNNLDDGAEVWSAGYPGLGDVPSWQLGKGNITNASAKIPQLIDPEITSLIQHSAVVDPGNSGGPLLIATPSGSIQYKVIGINTWKAYNRQAANFAIPASVIKSFIDKSLISKSDKISSSISLENKCNELVVATTKKDAYKSIARFISSRFIAKSGEFIFKDVLSKAPSDVRDEIITIFTRLSPIEGMRYAIAYKIQSALINAQGEVPLVFTAVEGNESGVDNEVSTKFTIQGEELRIFWIKEYGLWRILSFPFDGIKRTQDNVDKGVSKVTYDERPYLFLIRLGGVIAFVDKPPLINVGISLKWDAFTSFGISVDVGQAVYINPHPWIGEDPLYEGFRLEAGPELSFQLPIQTDAVLLAPQIGVKAGFIVDTAMWEASPDGLGFFILVKAGVCIGFGSDSLFVLGADFLQYIVLPEGMTNNPGIGLWLGFAK